MTLLHCIQPQLTALETFCDESISTNPVIKQTWPLRNIIHIFLAINIHFPFITGYELERNWLLCKIWCGRGQQLSSLWCMYILIIVRAWLQKQRNQSTTKFPYILYSTCSLTISWQENFVCLQKRKEKRLIFIPLLCSDGDISFASKIFTLGTLSTLTFAAWAVCPEVLADCCAFVLLLWGEWQITLTGELMMLVKTGTSRRVGLLERPLASTSNTGEVWEIGSSAWKEQKIITYY